MANESDGQVVYEVRANTSKLDSDLDAADRKVVQASEKTAKKQEDAQKDVVKSAKKANSDIAKDTEKTQQEVAETVKKESGKVAEHFGKNAEKMSQSGRKAAEEVESSVAGMASSIITKIGQVAAAAASVKTLVNTMKAAVGEAVAAETSFAKVNTLLSENADRKKYFNDIKNASRSTGVVVSDLSEAVYSALSASVDEESAVDFTQSAVKLAKGGFTETATAVDVLTTTINAYELEASEATRISDILITTQNKGKTTVGELASSMGQTIPIAKSAGTAIEDLAAQYAVMTKNGVATAESGTQIKAMLNELNAAGTNVSDTLKELTGKSFEELQTSGMNTAEVLNILKNHAEASGQKLSDMFGSVEAGAAALTLLKDGGADFNNILTEMQNSAGATEKAYNTMANTTEERFNKLKNNLTIAVEEIGEKLLPTIEEFFEYIDENSEELGEIIEGVGGAISELLKISVEAIKVAWEHKDVIIAIVSAMAAYKAALAISSLINTLKNALGSATIAQKAFNLAVSANPVGLAAAAISAAVTVITSLADNLGQASKAAEEYASAINEINNASENTIRNTENEMSALSDKVRRYDELRNSAKLTAGEEAELKSLAEELQGVFGDSVSVVDSLTGKYNDLTLALKNYSAQQVASATLEAHKTQLTETLSLLADLEQKRSDTMLQIGKDKASLTNNTLGLFDGAYDFLAPMLGMVTDASVIELDKEIADAQKRAEEIKKLIASDSEDLYSLIGESGNDFVSKTDELGEKILDTAETVATQLKNKFTDVASALVETKSKYDILTVATEEANSAGALSVTTLKNISSAYPQLQEQIDKYLSGLISERELLEKMSEAYEEDQQNYYKYMLVKAGYSEDFVESALNGSDIIADYFMENYKIDLKNYKDYISRKQAIQETFDSYLAGGVSAWWTEENGWSKDFQHLKGDAQKAIMDIVHQYQDAMIDLEGWGEKQSNEQFQADFANIRERTFNTFNADKKNTSSSGSSSRSTGKSASRSGGTGGQTINITSYIPTVWDDAKKANEKLIAGGVAASLVGDSKSGKLISGLTSNAAASVKGASGAEASLSDVVKAIKGLEQSNAEMRCVVTAILNVDSVALARQTIKGVAAIEKTTGKKVF